MANDNSELINYYKIEESKDYITWEEEYSDLRYNHVKEMIQYYEAKIYEKAVGKLNGGTNLSRTEIRERAKKKAWIDFIPVELPPINKEERDIFQINKEDGVEKYKSRLRKKLKPKFKRAVKIRELSDAKSKNFASVSIAQLVDWVLTFLDACSDSKELTKDDIIKGNFNVNLNRAKVSATSLVKEGPKTEASDMAEEVAKKIINRMDSNIAKQTLNGNADFPQPGGKKTGVSKKEIKEGVKNIFGDLAAIDYPAWHATALMIKKKYYKELKKAEDDSKVVRKHANYVMSFYIREIFLNKVAAFFMKWFMKQGIKILKKSFAVAFPLDLTLASTGLTLVFMGPPLADTIREKLAEAVDVTLFETENPSEEIEIDLPAELFKDVYQNTIERYDLVQKLEGYSSLYYSFTQEIEGEELSFIVKHEIDAPGAWIGVCNFLKGVWDKGLGNLYSVFPDFAKKKAGPDRVITNLDEIENIVESYNEKLTRYDGIEAVYGYIDDIKKLAKDRNHTICQQKQGAYAGQFPELNDEKINNKQQKAINDLVQEEEVPLPALDRFYDLEGVLHEKKKRGWNDFRFRAYFNPEVKKIIKNYNNEDYSLDDIDFQGYSYFYYGGERYDFYLKVFEGENLAEAKKITLNEGTEKRLLTTYTVKKLTTVFQKLISKTRSIDLYKHVLIDERRNTYTGDVGVDIILAGESSGGLTPLQGIHKYKVIFKTLDQIAKKKGIKEKEMKRGRLLSGEKLLDCNWYSLKKIKEATDYDEVNGEFPLSYRLTKDFVILHQDRTGQQPKNEETLRNIKFPNYQPNWDTLYGSAKEEQSGDKERFKFKPGERTSFHYQGGTETKLASNPNGKIEINGVVIGDEVGIYEPVKGTNENMVDFLRRSLEKGKLRYKQDLQVEGKTLRVKYIYDLDGGWINSKHSTLPYHTRDPYLIIQYKYINKQQEVERSNWDRITIKQFKNGDYGISIPDKGGSLPGSRSENSHKISSQEAYLEDIEVEDAKEPGCGKIKAAGTFLKAKEITAAEVEEKRAIWKLSEEETLSDIAKLFYNDMSRWQDLEKEDGSNYTKEEAREIPVGTKIYIP